MSKHRLVTAGGTLAAIVLMGCQAAGPSVVPGPTESPGPAPTSSPMPVPPTAAAARTNAPIDLTVLAYGPEDAPPGMAHDETITGRDALTLVVVSGDGKFESLDGFVDGRASLFSGEAGALLTAALAFEDAISADFASHHYQGELTRPDGYGFTDIERNTVAFESMCGTGPHPHFEDLIENICIWHTGPITFLVGGPIPMADVLAIAEDLAERAGPWTEAGAP